jgi:glycosyltransferase involved in cell wall biosynthesis
MLGVAESFLSVAPSTGPAPHLLSVGALVQGKGHDLALRSVAMTAQRRPLVIVAPRPDPAEEARLQALASEIGVDLDPRIRDQRHRARRAICLSPRDPLPCTKRAARVGFTRGASLRLPGRRRG